MKISKQYRGLFLLSCITMALFAATIVLMPLTSSLVTEVNQIPIYINAAAFWVLLIGGYLSIIAFNLRIKRHKRRKQRRRFEKRRLPGIIRFFSNPIAGVFDTIFLLSLLGFILYKTNNQIDGVVSYVLLSILVFAFHMHCILNGRNYNYIRNYGN